MKKNKVSKTNYSGKDTFKEVERTFIKTDSNFKLPKSVKRLCLSKDKLRLFVDAIERTRIEDLTRGKKKDKQDET